MINLDKDRICSIILEQKNISLDSFLAWQDSNNDASRVSYKAAQKELATALGQVLESKDADLCMRAILAVNQAECRWVNNLSERVALEASPGSREEESLSHKIARNTKVKASAVAAIATALEASRALAVVADKPEKWADFRDSLPATQKGYQPLDRKKDVVVMATELFSSKEYYRVMLI